MLQKSILAGMLIGSGGIAFLSAPNKIIGAFLFAIGLLSIIKFKFILFTGKLCELSEKGISLKLLHDLGIVYTGNIIGTFLIATGIKYTRYGIQLQELASNLMQIKITDTFLSLIILGIICNIFIYIATRSNSQLITIMAIMSFILIGAEHSIADIFYAQLSNINIIVLIKPICAITIGNLIGGNLFKERKSIDGSTSVY